MGDTNVKIKLTADGKQVRDEIKLIDRDIQELGGTNKTPKKGSKSKENSQDNQQGNNQQPKKDSRETAKQEMRDKTNQKLTRELTLIRKELQKMNGTSGYGGGQQSAPPTPPSGDSNDNGGSQNPSPSPDDNTGNKKLLDVLGKLGTVVGAFKALSGAFNYVSQGAASSRSGESLAYKTYGSTLAYDDYYTAKKDAYSIGLNYGYDYKETMSAADVNMSKAGFTTLENYQSDIDSILKGSKAWGYDPNTLADTSGYMTSIGVTESGDQQKFVNMLSRSIVDAQMTGREDEQIRVLEEIAESLGQVNTSVSQKNVNDQLNMYNSLVDQNENLKGSRGSGLMTTMSSLAQSGDTSLDILAGMNTKYTGKEGYIELRKLAEENPTEYWKQVIQGARSYGMSDTDIQYKMLMKGLSTSQIEDYFGALDNVENFDSSDTTLGEEEIQKRLDNYNNSDVPIYEQNEIQKQDAKESAGDALGNNPIANWWKKTYNNMPSWARGALGIGGEVAKGVGLIGGTKLVGKWLGGSGGGSSIFSSIGSGLSSLGGKVSSWFGGSGAAGAGGTTAGSAGAAGAGGGSSLLSTIGAYGYNAMSSASQFIASNPALTSWLGAYAPAIPDAVHNTMGIVDDVKDSIHAKTDEEYGEYKNWYDTNYQDNYGKGNFNTNRENAFNEMQAAIKEGTYEDWVDKYVENAYKVNPDTGKTKDFDLLLNQLASVINGDSKSGYTVESSISTAEDAKKYYKSLSESDLSSLLSLDTLRGGYDDLLNSEKAKVQAKAQAGNYYGDYESRTSSPFYGSEGMFDYSIGSYTDDDLQTLKNTMIKDYVENGSINVQDYFGHYNYQGGDYAKDVNSVLQDMFGKDTGVSSWFGKELFSGQNETGNKLSKGIESILDDYVGEYDSIVEKSNGAATESNTEAIKDNTEAIKKLYEENGLTYGAPYSNEYIESTLKQNNQQNTTPLNPFSSNSKTSGSLFGNAFSWLFGGKSHATGNDYVPYDNYPSLLHQGEMVLTKQEADDYRQGKVDHYGNILNGNNVSDSGGKSHATGTIDINIHFDGSVDGMSIDNQNKMMEMVKQQLSGVNLQSLLSNGYQRIQNC